MAFIETRELEKIYCNEEVETRALNGVSFSVEEGEFVAVTGPSGSGKSTLLHVLGFLDKHTNGNYYFDGKTIDDYSDEQLAHIRNKKMGFVFQAFNLLPRATVLDNVKLPLIYSDKQKEDWEKMAIEAIKSVDLMHRIEHSPSQLSGGEKQRVAIARALVNEPQIIFADEPTGNLDSKSGKMIMEVLQDLNEKKGHTILLITHETYTAEHAERIIHMQDGQIDSDKKVNQRLHAKEGFTK